MKISPYELCQKLGIPIVLDEPAFYGPLWTGKALHFSWAYSMTDNDSQIIVRCLSDEEIFHEIGHILLCSSSWLKEPNYGYDLDPITCWGVEQYARRNQSQQDQDQEEFEADTLGDMLSFLCGVSQESIIGSMADKIASDEIFSKRDPTLTMPKHRFERKLAAIKSARFQQIFAEVMELMS